MKNMLGITLGEVSGPFDDLNKKLCSEEGKKWLEAFKLFLRGEPTWTDGMINIPIEWSLDLGEVSHNLLQEHTELYNKGHGGGWRLPTDKELSRALKKMKPDGFTVWKYYWSGTENINGNGYTITYTYNGMGGLGSMPSIFFNASDQKNPHLRLCRPIKLPE